MLNTGFEWEAGLFVEIYRDLSERLGRDVAKEILARAMYRAGFELGREARTLVETGNPVGMAKAWDLLYGMGSQQAEQLDEDHFVIQGISCAAFNLFRRRGLSEQEIRFVCDAFCIADVGHAEGFDKQMHFQHTSRLMRGDKCCRWEFASSEQKPAEAAIPPIPH
jgi:hypothetical protein